MRKLSPHRGRSCGGLSLDLLLGSAAGSITVLLSSGNVPDVSATTSALGVSSLGLGAPVISSLLSMESATGLGVLSLLLVEVRPTSEPTDHMRVRMLLTSRRGTSSLKSQ